ncbi:unnamed protein product, partial [Oppiella nova]
QPKDCLESNGLDVIIADNPTSHLCQLLAALKSCTKSLDVCMYCLSFKPIVEIIEDLSVSRNIMIRIITNGHNQRHSLASDERQGMSRLRRLFNSGVQLKFIVVTNDGLMHHKFALIDDCLLINGSLNWTENAIFHSYNDCVITADPRLVYSFSRQFNHFWSLDS